jgi:hypothetical protein
MAMMDMARIADAPGQAPRMALTWKSINPAVEAAQIGWDNNPEMGFGTIVCESCVLIKSWWLLLHCRKAGLDYRWLSVCRRGS